MSKAIPKITIDTNCVVGLFDSKSQTATSVNELRELMRYALSGGADIAITTRVEVDFSRDKDERRRNEMLHLIGMIPIVGTVARWDQSKWDGADILVGSERQGLLDEVKGIVFPGLTPDSGKFANKLADIDHLVGHKLSQRDVFVTDDSGILRRYPQLRDGVGIIVMTPAEALRYVDAHHARLRTRSLETIPDDSNFRNGRIKGTVLFKYSSNNGRFLIGEGINLFETRWSSASERAIHAYKSPPTVAGIALADGALEIAEITKAEGYDFTSDCVTPNLGEVIVLQNANGIYAAIKIQSISYRRKAGERYEMKFDFVILPDGSSNFSKV